MKNFDNSYLSAKINLIAGVDEAGRGPLAGPVVAAAVIFDDKTSIPGVTDSKKLSNNTRVNLYEEITNKCISYGVGIVDIDVIEEINILQSSLKAMGIAVIKLDPKPDLVIIDGNKTFIYEKPTIAIVKGDSKSFAIAAASIIAKVTRDRLMQQLSEQYPQYCWHKNKGYGTREHIEAIKTYGASPFHRKSFLGNILTEQQLELTFNKITC
ncbi:MAG: ribonuclease HII [Ignavibacteriae bacterium HGW-Ignavibacteriae-2]|jgi:ribonuclease HII|nr:ribonuclease HII [Bacteroidota bacterium]PKL87448.1 MAG: ribonuclease HII [Ignavibacteriae bacterium HGW-Ignavibacteriae-2]